MAEQRTWSSVRTGPNGERKGWCGHRHRYQDTAVTCARQLNRSWAGTGDTWAPTEGGHRSSNTTKGGTA